MTRSTPQLELDNQLCFALYRASRAAVRAYAPLLEPLGLTYVQYLTLLVLWEAGEPLTVGAIGDRLRLDSGTLTPVLKRLDELGLVERNRDPSDERRVLITLTRAGDALHERASAIPLEVFSGYGIDVGTAVDLLGRLGTIAESLERLERERSTGRPVL